MSMGSPDCPCIGPVIGPTNCVNPFGENGHATCNLQKMVCRSKFRGHQGCKAYNKGGGVCDVANPPNWCLMEWCYVNRDTCKNSEHSMHMGGLYGEERIFWSYTTCLDTDDDYRNPLEYDIRDIRGKQKLRASIYGVQYPYHYKLNATGGYADYLGLEGYNQSIPWGGSVVEYLKDVVSISDYFDEIEFRERSDGAATAAKGGEGVVSAPILDVQSHISDVAAGIYWITSERLALTGFTSPFHVDTLKLMVPNVRYSDLEKWYKKAKKLFTPFDKTLWLLLILELTLVTLLTVWFASRGVENSGLWKAFNDKRWEQASMEEKVVIWVRQFFEAFAQHVVFLSGQSVKNDYGSPLEYRILMFGHSTLVLVWISAYVGELASYLTVEDAEFNNLESIDEAMQMGMRICAPRVLEVELVAAFPAATFVFMDHTNRYQKMFESYQSACDTILVSSHRYLTDLTFVDTTCKYNLSAVDVDFDIPMAFPVTLESSAALSMSIFDQMEEGRNYQRYFDKYKVYSNCNEPTSPSTGQLTIANFGFPLAAGVIALFVALAFKLLKYEDDVHPREKEREIEFVARKIHGGVSLRTDSVDETENHEASKMKIVEQNVDKEDGADLLQIMAVPVIRHNASSYRTLKRRTLEITIKYKDN